MRNQLEELTNGCMRFYSSKRIEIVNCEIEAVSISLFRIRPTPEFNYKRLCPNNED